MTGERWTALHAAIENDQFEIVRMLVDRGADIAVDSQGLTALDHAVEIAIDGSIQANLKPGEEPTGMVEYFLSLGADLTPGLRRARAYGNSHLEVLLVAAAEGRKAVS